MLTAKKAEIVNLEYVGQLIGFSFCFKTIQTKHYPLMFNILFIFINKPLLTQKVKSLPRFGSFCKISNRKACIQVTLGIFERIKLRTKSVFFINTV